MAGYDSEEVAQIYNIDLFGSMTTEKFISTGSGSPVAYGYLETEFRDNMKVDDGYKIAIHAITRLSEEMQARATVLTLSS